ncbi:MAG: hypothetical protein ACLFQV_05620 [Vulcanimicrobiota bacterium]
MIFKFAKRGKKDFAGFDKSMQKKIINTLERLNENSGNQDYVRY